MTEVERQKLRYIVSKLVEKRMKTYWASQQLARTFLVI